MGCIDAELPGFLYALAHEFAIPTELRSERFGVTHFHHPDLLQELNSLAPEAELLNLIDDAIFRGSPHHSWTGTAAELEQLLRDKRPYVTERLLKYRNSCGTWLQRLANQGPRIRATRTADRREWTIVQSTDG